MQGPCESVWACAAAAVKENVSISIGEHRHRGGEAGDRRAADGHILDDLTGCCIWSTGLCTRGSTTEHKLKVKHKMKWQWNKKTALMMINVRLPEPTWSQHVRIGSMTIYNIICICDGFWEVCRSVLTLFIKLSFDCFIWTILNECLLVSWQLYKHVS